MTLRIRCWLSADVHRGFQQERPHLLGLSFQYLLGQVVEDEAVAAGEGGHEPRDVGLSAH
jgi:hypothetical protein